jgi:hypothetical protein
MASNHFFQQAAEIFSRLSYMNHTLQPSHLIKWNKFCIINTYYQAKQIPHYKRIQEILKRIHTLQTSSHQVKQILYYKHILRILNTIVIVTGLPDIWNRARWVKIPPCILLEQSETMPVCFKLCKMMLILHNIFFPFHYRQQVAT